MPGGDYSTVRIKFSKCPARGAQDHHFPCWFLQKHVARLFPSHSLASLQCATSVSRSYSPFRDSRLTLADMADIRQQVIALPANIIIDVLLPQLHPYSLGAFSCVSRIFRDFLAKDDVWRRFLAREGLLSLVENHPARGGCINYGKSSSLRDIVIDLLILNKYLSNRRPRSAAQGDLSVPALSPLSRELVPPMPALVPQSAAVRSLFPTSITDFVQAILFLQYEPQDLSIARQTCLSFEKGVFMLRDGSYVFYSCSRSWMSSMDSWNASVVQHVAPSRSEITAVLLLELFRGFGNLASNAPVVVRDFPMNVSTHDWVRLLLNLLQAEQTRGAQGTHQFDFC